jgi:hypothetical protein
MWPVYTTPHTPHPTHPTAPQPPPPNPNPTPTPHPHTPQPQPYTPAALPFPTLPNPSCGCVEWADDSRIADGAPRGSDPMLIVTPMVLKAGALLANPSHASDFVANDHLNATTVGAYNTINRGLAQFLSTSATLGHTNRSVGLPAPRAPLCGQVAATAPGPLAVRAAFPHVWCAGTHTCLAGWGGRTGGRGGWGHGVVGSTPPPSPSNPLCRVRPRFAVRIAARPETARVWRVRTAFP